MCLFVPMKCSNCDECDADILLLAGAWWAVCRCQLSGVLQQDYGLGCVPPLSYNKHPQKPGHLLPPHLRGAHLFRLRGSGKPPATLNPALQLSNNRHLTEPDNKVLSHWQSLSVTLTWLKACCRNLPRVAPYHKCSLWFFTILEII